MITVSVAINGVVIMARSAVNVGEKERFFEPEKKDSLYEVDDGSKILHNQGDGAVDLAIKLLKTIKEVGVEE